MTVHVALLAAVAGYIVGSIPFALIVTRLFGRGKRLKPAEFTVPSTEDVLRSDAVSATAVRLQLGARYGCLTSILDMAKAAAVALAFRLAYPDAPYVLIASGFAVVGHIWPLFNRFRGGRGQSPAIGGLFVVDWPTPLVVYPLAQVLGLVTGSRAHVGRFAPMLLASGWLYLRFHDLSFVYYGLGLFAVRMLAMRDEIVQYARIRRSGGLQSLAHEVALMGYGEILKSFGLRIRQLSSRLRRRRGE